MDNFNAQLASYNSGKSINQVAKEFGISHETLRRKFIKAGIDTSLFRPSFIEYNLDPLWLAEFRGFFYGEGSVYIHKRNAFLWDKTYLPNPVYRPDLKIGLRDDDGNVLREIQRVLGGNLSFRKAIGKSNPSISWQLVGFRAVYPLLKLLSEGHLPSKKKKEFETMIEFSEARFKMPEKGLSAENIIILDAFFERMKLLKSYTGG